MKRWIYAAVGVLVLLFAGIIYAWSIMSLPIAGDYSHWSKFQLSITFTIAMSAFCLGGLLGGILIGKKINVKINMYLAAVFSFAGLFFASIASTPIVLYIGFGLLLGLGSGLAYNAVLSTMGKWFPDKQGLISGVLLMGFGLGSFIIGKVYGSVTPMLSATWHTSFRFMGLLIPVVYLASSFFFVLPEAVQTAQNTETPLPGAGGFTPFAMLRTLAFWTYCVWSVVLSAAGLVLVSQASGILSEVSTVEGSTASTVVGLISIFNGFGRVMFGNLYDKKGYQFTMWLVILLFLITALILMAAISTGMLPLLVLGFIAGGISYGGVTPTNSAISSEFFGCTHYPVNYSIICLCLLPASTGSAISGALYDRTGSYQATMLLIAVFTVSGSVALLLLKKPQLDKTS